MERRLRPIVKYGEAKYEFVGVEQKNKRKMPIASASTSVRQTQNPNDWKKKKTCTPSPSASRETVDSEGATIPGEFCQYTIQLGDDLAYLHLLKAHNAVTPVDEFYRAFVMQDFNFTTKSLKDEFLIIRRQATKVPEGYLWLYGCSCNSARQTMLNSVSFSLSGPVEDFDHPYNKCYHIEAMENIASQFTDVNLENEFNRRIEEMNGTSVEHSYEKQGPKVVIYPIEGHNHAVVVHCDNSYSIVKIDFKGPKPVLKCSTCCKKKECESSCIHIDSTLHQDLAVSDVTQTLLQQLNIKPKWRSRYIPMAVSSTKIPFSPAPEEQKKNRKDFRDLVHEDGSIHLIPDSDGHCVCGGDWLEETELECTRIISATDMLHAKVYIRNCSSCDRFKDYDGIEDQLLNMGVYLISHDLLRKYLHQFITEGTPLISFYQELCWQQVESGNLDICAHFSYNRFRYAWYGFLNLLDADYTCGFSCPECGSTPSTVVMDGVALGLRKSFMPWKNFLKSLNVTSSLDGSSHNTRIFINNQHTRRLMVKFCDCGLSAKEFAELRDCVALYQPSLTPFLLVIDSACHVLKCPDILKELLMCLASNYPVCGFLHYNENVFKLVLELAQGSDISSRMADTVLLHTECPILGSVMQYYQWIVPEYMRPILRELVEKAKYPFKGSTHELLSCNDDCPCTGEGLFQPCQNYATGATMF